MAVTAQANWGNLVRREDEESCSIAKPFAHSGRESYESLRDDANTFSLRFVRPLLLTQGMSRIGGTEASVIRKTGHCLKLTARMSFCALYNI